MWISHEVFPFSVRVTWVSHAWQSEPSQMSANPSFNSVRKKTVTNYVFMFDKSL